MTTKITAGIIKENIKLIDYHQWKELFSVVKQGGGSIRFAAHAIHSSIDEHYYLGYNMPVTKELPFGQLKMYSNDSVVLEKLRTVKNGDFYEIYTDLICFMKNHHCYVDITYNCPKDIFDEKPPQDKSIKIFIDKSEKTIANDPSIYECFEKFSDLLLKKATASDATLMDVFFMLAYHTIDKIEFHPKEDMTELVAESLEGVSDYADANSECNDGCERAFWEQLEHYIERHGYIDRVHYFDENGGHVIELPRGRGEQFRIEELLGCYIDRSNQNCSLSKDNNIIYLCKEYIEAFASKFDGFNYDLVKNNIMEELWDCDGISYDQMFELVLAHEFGHLAFSYLDYDKVVRILSEGRANFFASYLLNMVDEKYISLIKITTQKQPEDYRKPILTTQDNYINELFP